MCCVNCNNTMQKVYLLFIIPFIIFSQEKIEFISKNPFSFQDIITDLKNQEEQVVYGVLKLPDDIKTGSLVSLIIAVAGSNGWAEHHHEYLEIYRKNGIATFELFSFESRGISSTVGDQTNVTTAMMVLDAYNAFEALVKRPMINPDKIGITGWSLGGGGGKHKKHIRTPVQVLRGSSSLSPRHR